MQNLWQRFRWRYMQRLCEEKKNFDIARSVFVYVEFSKNIIHKYKFQNKRGYYKFFSRLLSNVIKDYINDVDYITYVPMRYWSILRRGYNQSAMMALFLSNKHKIKIIPLLKKKKKTINQHKIENYYDRIENLKNAFSATKDLRDKKILLVDDIMTTGTTVDECAKALKKNGARCVIIATIASTDILDF